MLLALLALVLEGALLLAMLAAAGLAFFMLHDPAVRRAEAIAKAYPQPEPLPVIGHLLHVVRPTGTPLVRPPRVQLVRLTLECSVSELLRIRGPACKATQSSVFGMQIILMSSVN